MSHTTICITSNKNYRNTFLFTAGNTSGALLIYTHTLLYEEHLLMLWVYFNELWCFQISPSLFLNTSHMLRFLFFMTSCVVFFWSYKIPLKKKQSGYGGTVYSCYNVQEIKTYCSNWAKLLYYIRNKRHNVSTYLTHLWLVLQLRSSPCLPSSSPPGCSARSASCNARRPCLRSEVRLQDAW